MKIYASRLDGQTTYWTGCSSLAQYWDMGRFHASRLRRILHVESLRHFASSLRRAAPYADSLTVMNRDLNEANVLDARASRLEAQLDAEFDAELRRYDDEIAPGGSYR